MTFIVIRGYIDMRFGESMTTIESSPLLIEGVRRNIAEDNRLFEINGGKIYRGPAGGFEDKVIFVGDGETPEARKASCLHFAEFLKTKKIPLRIWHEVLDDIGALIIDKPTIKNLSLLQDYMPE